ncbi:MAG: cytochrome-c peroxidase [Janthinobacterium lividum]
MKAKTNLVASVILAAILFSTAAAAQLPSQQAEPITPIQAPTPQDPRRIALGAALFSDPRLSSSGHISCASCHDLRTNGASVSSHDLASSGRLTAVNTPTVFNAALSFRLNWRGDARSLEMQADDSLRRADIMSATPGLVLAAINKEPDMRQRFRTIYGHPADWEALLDALATFERTLVTPGGRFDQWLKGDSAALTSSERDGYRLFKSVGCVSCHQGVGIGGNLFEKVGVVKPDLPDSGKIFRVPSLRNVAATPPYFHDGSAPTLAIAVRHMASGQLGLALADHDVGLIVSFLKTLDGQYDGHAMTAAR